MPDASVDVAAVLEDAARFRRGADELLQALGVRDQLARYGEVVFVGSYRWNLMQCRDIDVNVINPDLNPELALDALTGFIRRGDFYNYTYRDSVRHALPWNPPSGYFLGLEGLFEGQQWSVEVWFKRAQEPDAYWIGERLTEESRRTILLFKRLRDTLNLPIYSYAVYEAVLLKGITDPEEFVTFARSSSAQ
jgi:hypothetical protein